MAGRSKRIGSFRIDRQDIMERTEDAALMFALMAFVPMRIELYLHTDQIEYHGYSGLFDEVPDGCTYRSYKITVHRNRDGAIHLVTAE